MNSCDTKTGVCEATTTPQVKSECQCGCGGACNGDPMLCKMHMWLCSFKQAKQAVEIDILKAKIQKLWGAKMEKEATVVLEAVEAKFKAIQATGIFKEELIAKFEQICKENK